MRGAALAACLLIATPIASATSTQIDAQAPQAVVADPVVIRDGTPVQDVLRTLADRGARIIWSEVLVRSWMRVESDATYATPLQALHAVLAPFHLKAERGPGDTWLVVRDESRDDALVLGGVRGRVVDAATGAGIRGAVVC